MKKIIVLFALLTATNFFLHCSAPQELDKRNPPKNIFDQQVAGYSNAIEVPEEWIQDREEAQILLRYLSPKALAAWKKLVELERQRAQINRTPEGIS